MGKQPHVLVIPYPVQGHVTPLLKLATKIAECGIKVTFVNTEFIEAKIMASMPEKVEWGMIRLVSIPDGHKQGDDQNDYIKTRDTMLRVMPGHLETLIENINKSSDCEHITCVIADICCGWALELAQKMDIPRAAVLPYAPGNLALTLRIPNLVEAGAIDSNGTAMTDELISISEEILPLKANELAWSCPDDLTLQKIFFDFACANIQNVRISNWVLSNSFYELD